jgi:hypothetical protein
LRPSEPLNATVIFRDKGAESQLLTGNFSILRSN